MGNLTAICVSSPLYIYVLGQHSMHQLRCCNHQVCVCGLPLFGLHDGSESAQSSRLFQLWGWRLKALWKVKKAMQYNCSPILPSNIGKPIPASKSFLIQDPSYLSNFLDNVWLWGEFAFQVLRQCLESGEECLLFLVVFTASLGDTRVLRQTCRVLEKRRTQLS